MNFVKVSNGKAELYNKGGGRLRTFGSGEIVSGDIHAKGEILVLTLKSGNMVFLLFVLLQRKTYLQGYIKHS